MSVNQNLVGEYIELMLERRRLAREDKKIKDKQKELQEQIITEFEEYEILDAVTVMGYNVKPVRELWAAAIDGDFERACEALVKTGHGEFVHKRFDGRKVSALIREYDADDAIPPELQDNLKISEVFKLSVTKASAKKTK